jgi:NMD protein affecting ribosome stability and mRNA decay
MKEEQYPSKKSKGLIRSLNRKATRDDMSPPVARKTKTPAEPAICDRCGAVFVRKTWRRNHHLSAKALDHVSWAVCPACEQLSHGEGQGKVVISGSYSDAELDAIRRRIDNVALRAGRTQPERRIVAIEPAGEALEVITTSQKLSHRIAHELKKAFGGHASYKWSDDGTLLATWERHKIGRGARA